jgi:hypothetical protein
MKLSKTIKILFLFVAVAWFANSVQSQWLTGYSFKRAITIQPGMIPNGAVLTNFPLLIDLSGSYLLTTANGGLITSDNGYDIVFSVDHTSILNHDIIYYEGTTTGEYKAWVQVPSIQDGTVIYMYYGNTSITSDPSTSATWGNGYEGVWQLDNDFLDASPFGRDGINQGSVDAGGIIYDAQDFEYSDRYDYIDVGKFNVSGTEMTISSWINIESTDFADGQILAKATGTQNPLHHYALSTRRVGGSYKLRYRLITDGTISVVQSADNLSIGNWYYASAVYDGSNMIVYVNGLESGVLAKTGDIIAEDTVSTYIGNNPGPQISPFDGIIDHVTISSAARSADWILAEYYNQGSPGTFYNLGPPLVFNGRLILPSNTYLTTNNNNIVLFGYLVNNGIFTHNGGTLIFAGSDQAITGTSTTEFNYIDIQSSSSTYISSPGQSLKGILLADGKLFPGGNLTLLSTATQTALVDGSGTGSISGNIIMQRYLPSGFGYHYFSSPFQSSTVNEFGDDMELGAAFPTFYDYDETRASSGWIDYTAPTNVLNPMEGYAVNFGDQPDPKTADATGNVNDGNMQLTLYNNNNTYTQGFNLVGNPYPSPIDWDASSGWTKTNIDDAIYFFKAGTTNQYLGTYSSYINGVSSDGIADNIIPAMQGFFVHVTDGTYPVTGILGFTNSVRSNDLAPPFFKEIKADSRSIIRINADFSDNQAPADPIVIYFDETSSWYFEPEKDALKRMNTDTRVPNFYLYSADTRKLSICGMPYPDENIQKIPVGINVENGGWIRFYATDKELFPSELHAYLVDAETGRTLDLRNDEHYDVYLDPGEINSRFYLIFSADKWSNPFSANELFTISRNGEQVWVTINLQFGEKGVLHMLNAQGQALMTKEVFGNEVIYINKQISSGIYILSLFSNKGVYSKKLLMP